MELTPSQRELAKILLLAFPAHRAVNTRSFMGHHLLIGKDAHYSEDFMQEMRATVTSNNETPRLFLLYKGYIKVDSYAIPYDVLTEKGIKAKELGGFTEYETWEKAEERKKNFEEFPKRKWASKPPAESANK